jgi:alpha-amylase
VQCYPSIGTVDVPHIISWADMERDLSAWVGNAMQSNAIHELYRLEKNIKMTHDEKIIADWRRLQASDHFYYMCTKYFSDGDVHKYFNPYDSPYDSYINFMNVLDHLQSRCSKQITGGPLHSAPEPNATECLAGAVSQNK